jgi:ribosomal protein S18 acetylase RimI-like enzyme
MKKNLSIEDLAIRIVDYRPEHQPWFEKLNRDWIEKYFTMEPLDFMILQHPEEHIINNGGTIIMAFYHTEIAGTVALKFVEQGVYELTKMGVDTKFQGQKIGWTLANAAIEKARKLGASKIILYSNTILAPAISLYRKLGFKEMPLDSPYKRGNIKMELALK